MSSITMLKMEGCTQYWQEFALCPQKINCPPKRMCAFVLFFRTCLTRMTNKTQVPPRCANNESRSRWFGTIYSSHSLWSVVICQLCMKSFGLTSSQHWNANTEAGVYGCQLPHFLGALCNDRIIKSRLIRRKTSTKILFKTHWLCVGVNGCHL